MPQIIISLDVLLYNILIVRLNPLVKICSITSKTEYPSPLEENINFEPTWLEVLDGGIFCLIPQNIDFYPQILGQKLYSF